jgi:uncharacterized Zn-binding protein involved in type VI secretion
MSRSIRNGRKQIVLGDMTSHGGVVITASPCSTWNGILIARKGDTVTCPLCPPHIFVIAEGWDGCLDFGIPVALEGHKTLCGAALIASIPG